MHNINIRDLGYQKILKHTGLLHFLIHRMYKQYISFLPLPWLIRQTHCSVELLIDTSHTFLSNVAGTTAPLARDPLHSIRVLLPCVRAVHDDGLHLVLLLLSLPPCRRATFLFCRRRPRLGCHGSMVSHRGTFLLLLLHAGWIQCRTGHTPPWSLLYWFRGAAGKYYSHLSSSFPSTTAAQHNTPLVPRVLVPPGNEMLRSVPGMQEKANNPSDISRSPKF